MMTKLRAYRAGSKKRCIRCKSEIKKGSVFVGYKELALSFHEACHAGTQYPMRAVCKRCVTQEEVNEIREKEKSED